MTITLTVREIMDKCLWDKVCDLRGLNEWAVNEGLMDMDEKITFTEEEAKTLGLI